MGKIASRCNVIKVGSRFHHIGISDGVISRYYYNTREEAEKKCDEKNDAISRREEHERISKKMRETPRRIRYGVRRKIQDIKLR